MITHGSGTLNKKRNKMLRTMPENHALSAEITPELWDPYLPSFRLLAVTRPKVTGAGLKEASWTWKICYLELMIQYSD